MDRLVVSEIFGPTFQGEGPSSGVRAGFVRLGRCNLTCRWCDTPYTWDWERFDPAVELREWTLDEVLAALDAMAISRLVVTGGEPLLQQAHLEPLLRGAAERGWAVEVETNGTIAPTVPAGLVARWNVSPKLAGSGVGERRYRPAVLDAFERTGRAAFKFVVSSPEDLDEVASVVTACGLTEVWVMPEATDAADLVERLRVLAPAVLDRGWNLTSRLHVLLWGDQRGV